jgi:hypothetical protein
MYWRSAGSGCLTAACFSKEVLKPSQVPDSGEVGVRSEMVYVREGACHQTTQEQFATLFGFALERG